MISYKQKADTDESIFSSLNSTDFNFSQQMSESFLSIGHTGQVGITLLMEKHTCSSMFSRGKIHNGVSKDVILKIYEFVIDVKKRDGLGQRKINRLVKEKFGVNLSENTISGWLHRRVVPFDNEKTQFKPKPIPQKSRLKRLYLNQKLSANEIADLFGVSTIIVITWLRKYGIKPRSHLESMNTANIKHTLREKKLVIPATDYTRLTHEKAYILGVLAGDGYINRKYATLEIKKDEEFIEEFSRCLEKVYGIRYPIKRGGSRDTLRLHVASEVICTELLKLGDFRTFSWSAPRCILQSKNKKIIGIYLRGLFDSEGSVSKRDLTFSSASKRGIISVRTLLHRLGIDSNIYVRGKYYSLRVYARHVGKFRDLVGFTIKRKMEQLL